MNRSISERVLEPGTLGEASEREVLAAHGGRGALVAYRRREPARPAVVFVHGYKDAPQCFAPLAEAFLERTDRQPWFFVYDDVGRYLDRVGDDLARALVDLAALHGRPPALQIVAHSMGGIVARCALNSLVEPRWFPAALRDPASGELQPLRGTDEGDLASIRLAEPHAADFERVDLLAVDTPWHGYADPPVIVRNALEQEGSFVDMVSNSAVFTHLHGVPLPAHFAVNYIEADNLAAGGMLDSVMGLGELSDEAFAALARFFAGEPDALAGLPRIANLLAALRVEEDYPRLEAQLRAAARDGLLDRARFSQIAAQSVPRLAGSHQSVLEHPGLFDEIARTFARPRR